MAAKDGVLSSRGGFTVKVDGLAKTVKALEAAGTDATELRDGMQRIGNILVQYAVPRAPYKSGRLAGSIRAGRVKTKAVVRMGGARVPYAGVVHYGWPARNISPQPVLTDALKNTGDQVLLALDEELNKLLNKRKLK